MHLYRTTDQIFNVSNGRAEYFDSNWMDSNVVVTPDTKEWDYKRELKLEDVNLWEVIYESTYIGVYASWDPYAEFYMITSPQQGRIIDTFYGAGSQVKVKNKLRYYNVYLSSQKIWVEPEEMWLYSPIKPNTLLSLP